MNSSSCFIDPSLLIPYGRECSIGLKALKRAWNAARTHPPGAKAAADRRRNLQGAHPGRGGYPERGKNYDGDKTHFLNPHRHFSKEAVHMPSGRMRNTQHLESPGGFESKPRGGAVGHPLGRPASAGTWGGGTPCTAGGARNAAAAVGAAGRFLRKSGRVVVRPAASGPGTPRRPSAGRTRAQPCSRRGCSQQRGEDAAPTSSKRWRTNSARAA